MIQLIVFRKCSIPLPPSRLTRVGITGALAGVGGGGILTMGRYRSDPSAKDEAKHPLQSWCVLVT